MIAVNHPGRVLGAAALLTAVAVVGVLRLEVLTAREALLPRDEPAVVRLEAFLEQFGAASDLIVVVEGDADGAFGAALVARLGQRAEVAQAIDRVEPRVLAERAWLLVPPAVLGSLANADVVVPTDFGSAIDIAQKSLKNMEFDAEVDLALAEKGLAALGAFLAEWTRHIRDPGAVLRVGPLLKPFGAEAEAAADGRFRSRDGRLSFLFVRAQDPSTEFAALDPFITAVRAETTALAAAWKSPPTVGFAGLPAVAWEEFRAVQADIGLVTLTSAGLILVLVFAWLRSWRRAVAIFVPMGLGVVWALGVTEVLIGHLTILTSSFTAILFGLGVDYGIFLSARVATTGSVAAGTRAALKPLLVAGGATALIFLTLATSDFLGFVELGLVAAVGVVLVVGATLLVQPAILTLLPLKPVETKEESVRPVRAHRGLAVAVVVLGLGGGVAGLLAGEVPFDYDVLGLLPKDSEAAHWQRRMSAESDFQAEVVLLTAPSVAEARTLAAAVGALPSVARVQSVDVFFPVDAAARVGPARRLGEKAAAVLPQVVGANAAVHATTLDALGKVLATLREVLETAQETAFSAGRTSMVKALDDTLTQLTLLDTALASPQAAAGTGRLATQVLDLFRQGTAIVAGFRTAHLPTPADLPPVLRDRFFGRDGSVAVYAWPRASVYDPEALARLNTEVLAVAPTATGFPITHHVFAHAVVASYRQGTLLAAAAALVFILVSVGRPRSIVLAILPLALGGLWMNGLLHVLDMPVNFASIIALPLVMGLAVDYGVWFAHTAEAHPDLPGFAIARRAGSAIALAAATTLAGLGAITLGQYQGVASMGRSLTLGLVACLIAALVVAPAVVQVFFRRKP